MTLLSQCYTAIILTPQVKNTSRKEYNEARKQQLGIIWKYTRWENTLV